MESNPIQNRDYEPDSSDFHIATLLRRLLERCHDPQLSLAIAIHHYLQLNSWEKGQALAAFVPWHLTDADFEAAMERIFREGSQL